MVQLFSLVGPLLMVLVCYVVFPPLAIFLLAYFALVVLAAIY